jgi:hypothetical protein
MARPLENDLVEDIRQVPAGPMPHVRQDLALRDAIAPEAVGDDTPPLELQAGQQPPEEAPGRRGAPPVLHQDVEHDPVLVHRTPEVVQLAGNADEHLIEVSGVARLRSALAQLASEVAAEVQAPAPDTLVGEDRAPLGEEQFDVAEAQAGRVHNQAVWLMISMGKRWQ